MNEPAERFALKEPTWRIFDSGWWFTVAGFGLAALLLLVPQIMVSPLWVRIATIIATCIGTGVVASAVLYIYDWFTYVKILVENHSSLLVAYRKLHEEWNGLSNQYKEATETIQKFITSTGEMLTFELGRVQHFRGKLYIRVRKRIDAELSVGQSVLVFGRDDAYFMGRFRIMQVEKDTYVAERDGHIDSLWLGYIMKSGAYEVDPPPGCVVLASRKDLDENA
jgi:hypothetical protein